LSLAGVAPWTHGLGTAGSSSAADDRRRLQRTGSPRQSTGHQGPPRSERAESGSPPAVEREAAGHRSGLGAVSRRAGGRHGDVCRSGRDGSPADSASGRPGVAIAPAAGDPRDAGLRRIGPARLPADRLVDRPGVLPRSERPVARVVERARHDRSRDAVTGRADGTDPRTGGHQGGRAGRIGAPVRRRADRGGIECAAPPGGADAHAGADRRIAAGAAAGARRARCFDGAGRRGHRREQAAGDRDRGVAGHHGGAGRPADPDDDGHAQPLRAGAGRQRGPAPGDRRRAAGTDRADLCRRHARLCEPGLRPPAGPGRGRADRPQLLRRLRS
jgi:hypothetical protein